MKDELADECDYVREASFLKAFGSSEFLGNDPRYKVPWVWEGSTSTVLVMERVNGVSVGDADASNLTRKDRNDVGFLFFCLHEFFFMHLFRSLLGLSNYV
jgi:aarF domain-containing kinase